MAVVCMVNSTAFPAEESSHGTEMSTKARPKCQLVNSDLESAVDAGYTGDLLWSPAMQSMLLSATFYGAIVIIPFAGITADKYSPKLIVLAATCDYIIVTLLTPLLARWSFYAYFVSRIIMGIGEGFIFPCFGCIVGKWFTKIEKSTVAAMYTSGNQLAAGFSTFISSYICTSNQGWPLIFYMFGSMGSAWCILWYTITTNSPYTNKFISKDECSYLSEHIEHVKTKSSGPVPWRHMLSSRPLIAAVLCQYTYNLQASILQAFLPTFFKEELMLPLHRNGIFTMVPFTAQLVSKNILGIFADYLKEHKIIGHTKCAKIFQSIGSFGSATMLIMLATLTSCDNPDLALPLLALYGIFFSAGICGFFTSILCIAPPFTGTTTSISMVFGMIGNICGPMMLGAVSKMGVSNKWVASFLLCSCSNVITAKVQFWAKTQTPRTSA
ncbi:transporter, major facilitator family protein [Dictyocaulus viviparus]|uniref:Transporter, major facilitator family protein n=1 Tax=Dictyocaulus viviparus TaxID=29172 RepID=A0A0D8XIS0_DICVI|nr:transporter, major facilitator family protein [Dictyocaulus viviparus]